MFSRNSDIFCVNSGHSVRGEETRAGGRGGMGWDTRESEFDADARRGGEKRGEHSLRWEAEKVKGMDSAEEAEAWPWRLAGGSAGAPPVRELSLATGGGWNASPVSAIDGSWVTARLCGRC